MRSLILGCAQFGKGYGHYVKTPEMSTEKITQILELAVSKSVTTLDHAQSYEGSLEKLATISYLDKFKVSTKIHWGKSDKSSIFFELKSNLEIFKKDFFESILIHNWFELEPYQRESAITFLVDLKLKGITKFIGISVYETSEILRIDEKIDIVQAPLSYFNTEFLNNETAKKLFDNGVDFHARSIFHQGTLLNVESLPKKFINFSKEFNQFCENHGITELQGSLAVFDSQELFTNLVIGVSDANQLREIIQTPTKYIDSILNETPKGVPSELIDPRKWVKT